MVLNGIRTAPSAVDLGRYVWKYNLCHLPDLNNLWRLSDGQVTGLTSERILGAEKILLTEQSMTSFTAATMGLGKVFKSLENYTD